jgi:CBS domain containing-hemolysin-like protein
LEPGSWYELVGALIALLLVALAKAVDAALAHVSRHRLRQLGETGRRGARTVDHLLDQPRSYASAMALLEAVGVVCLAGFLADIARREHLSATAWPALVVAGVLLLFFGWGLPRSLARRSPEGTATALAGFAAATATLARPLVALYDLVIRGLLFALRRPHPEVITPPAEEEFTVLIGGENGEGFEGLIEEDEREMIDAVLHLEERMAREIMVPRVDVVAVPETATLVEAVETIQRHGHSRLPVYADSIDHIVGVLYAKDLLRFVARKQTTATIAALVRPPHFVPESKRVDDLLHELQAQKVHMAIVVDEYGGTAGLVTIEDILEEIVGEILDEYDVAAPLVEEVSENEVLADGRLSVEEVSDLLDLGWPEEERGTIAGLVQRELGRLPAEGEELDYDGVHITVLAVDRHRLKQLRVTKHQGYAPGEAPDAPPDHADRADEDHGGSPVASGAEQGR